MSPSIVPTLSPTKQPTVVPTFKPTSPTVSPTISPTSTPYVCSEPFFYSITTDDIQTHDDNGGPNNIIAKGLTGQTCCDGYPHVIINSSVTVIDHKTFYGCPNLKSIIIPSSVTFIGNSIFIYYNH